MKSFDSVDEVLDFAIKLEQDAVDFYTELSNIAMNKDMRSVFEQFAREEISHKVRLISVKESGIMNLEPGIVSDLHISDYAIGSRPSSNMSYADALILAMKREKAAYKLYLDLSNKSFNEEMKSLFLSLAIEESKHKLRFELEYDEFVLRDN